jgi:hypothetical protein
MRVRRFEREGERALRRPVKRHAKRNQVAHPRRAILGDQPCNYRIDEPSARCNRVCGVLLRAVLRVERRCEPALRPGRRCGLPER